MATGMEAPDSFEAGLGLDHVRQLTEIELDTLLQQNSRLVPHHQAENLEKNAKKHWDLFYKRNETRFFKDRHWTTREFEELLGGIENSSSEGSERKVMLEVGCGVGNLVFPLMEEGFNMFIYACDLSHKAIDLVRSHLLFNEHNIKAFQSDVTTDSLSTHIPSESVDIVTMIFVLSAIHPNKFVQTLKNILCILKPGGMILFRDYGLYDMAQLRFKPGHKISENFYMRQDGTRSYYFTPEYLADIFTSCGYEVINNGYVHRRTVNKKEDVDVPRIFVQGKFSKPPSCVVNSP